VTPFLPDRSISRSPGPLPDIHIDEKEMAPMKECPWILACSVFFPAIAGCVGDVKVAALPDAAPPVESQVAGDAGTSPAEASAQFEPDATSIGLLCADVQSVLSTCPGTLAVCASAVAAECATVFAPLRSAAYARALHGCAPTLLCQDKGALSPEQPCISVALRQSAPTAAQWSLATAVCSACAQSAPTLEGGVNCTGHVQSLASTGRLLSSSILQLSDSFAEQIFNSHCTSNAALQFPGDYDNCENSFLNCVADDHPPDPAACNSD
jgi:hypothetical protein